MTRTIWNAGQGAMNVEDFGRYKIVFDCGTVSRGAPRRIIKEAFRQDEYIKAVFISHFDADHVNYLESLLNYCNVEIVFIPLITDEEYALSLWRNRGDRDYIEFIDRLQEGDRIRNTQVIRVKALPLEDRDEPVPPEEPLDISEYGVTGKFEISSGTEVIVNRGGGIDEDWVCLPFNFQYEKRHKLFAAELRDLMGFYYFDVGFITARLADILEKEEMRRKIKDIYSSETIPGTINGNSMVVFSGPRNEGLRQYLSDDCCPKYRVNIHLDISREAPAGCLYTGDYEADGEQEWCHLVKYYGKYWRYTGLVQVPHHGSRRNFNRNIIEMGSMFFINAGTKNKYKHPHVDVLTSLILSGKPFFWVNEQEESRLVLEINA